ncbi:MAG: hypothetical protein JKY31_07675 [Rhodobacteraceae bacterium]|nr:hypothetical protein [Paracoccaceae bacterium]
MIESGWTTADYAFLISLCSLALASASFIWNIWAKFIYPKPKVKINVGISYCDFPSNSIVTAHSNGELSHASSKDNLTNPSVSFSATNHGPGEVILQLTIGTFTRFRIGKKSNLAHFNPYNDYPDDLTSRGSFSGGIPKKLEVGETFTAYFPIMKDWVNSDKLKRFGFSDSFDRIHLCSSKDGRDLGRLILEPPVETIDD